MSAELCWPGRSWPLPGPQGYGTGKMWWRAQDGAPIDDFLDAQLENEAERAFTETRRDDIDSAFETLHF